MSQGFELGFWVGVLRAYTAFNNIGRFRPYSLGCWQNFANIPFHKQTVSPTYFFTNIHFTNISQTESLMLVNVLRQHKIFEKVRNYFSPTYRKVFTNILHQHTFKFLSSPTYSFTNIQKIIHQHTFFHQHISPTSLQPKKPFTSFRVYFL